MSLEAVSAEGQTMQNKIQTPTWIAGAALGLALLAGGLTSSVVHSSSEEPLFTLASETREQVIFDQGFSPVVKRAAPAVVNISSSRIVRSPESSQLAPMDDSFLRRFFGEEFTRQFRIPRERRERSLGSGVIVNSSGYILTNSHVVEGATEVKIWLSDDRELSGQVIGTDPGTDVGVLKINADRLSTLPFADSSKVEVGDIALALGNPFGVGRTVTMGIVSATGRGGLGIEDYEDFIQTDASINPGNSGGPLVNVRGELIGVNTAILSPSGVNLGIGFAVPSNMARAVMEQLIKTGKVTRGYLGASVQDITSELSSAMKLGQTNGALVADVDPKGPAARSGLQPGDIIVEANGKPIEDQRSLRLLISAMAPGSQINLRIMRNGQSQNVNMTLAELPSPKGTEQQQSSNLREKPSPQEPAPERLGVAIAELTPDIAEELKLPATVKGVVLADVEDGSIADEAGLQPGDVIVEVNRKPTRTVNEFQSEIVNRGTGPLLLLVNREGRTRYVALKHR
jgi:serine protease Do